MLKLVSIVLPTYNGERFLADSIESVINQTYKNWELIIINDCSIDKTLEIAQAYAAKDERIKVYSNNKNLKIPKSLNYGFSMAKGEYFTWTSDDNIYKPEAIEYMVDFLQKNKNIDMVTCKNDFINEDKTLNKKNMDFMERTQFELWKRCNIGACFMYTRDIALKVGGYSEAMFCAEDYDYWYRIAIEGNIAYSDENLYLYRINSQSLSSTRWYKTAENSLKIRIKYFSSLMEKFKVSEEQQIKYIIGAYLERGENEWVKLGKEINKTLLISQIFPARLKIFLRKVFSIVNLGNHKLITILGFKIKIRRKKK